MGLTSVAIRRPVFVLMLVAALIVLGFNAMSKMRLENNPKVDFPFISVSTIYPGAGPSEIETQVTKRVEDAVASVNGVKNITSTSAEGQSTVSIEFNIGVSSDVAGSDVREKVAAIRGLLPTDARDPVVQKFDVNSQPIIYYGLIGNRPSRDLRDMADNIIQPRLSKIPGVAAVSVSGGDIRQINIAVHKDRLDAYGLPIQQLVSLLQGNNLNFPVGHVIEGNREYSVRVVGEYNKVSQIGETRIHMPNGQTVKLSDIADIQDSMAERRVVSRINQGDSVALIIQKTSEGNTVDVAKGVHAEIEQLKKELPPDVKWVLNQDLSVQVTDSVNDVKASLFLGAFLAVAVVYLFLHNIRGTFIVAIAIPTSIIATFLPMYAFGFTLNGMTLLALSLSVGILVDDSIVVLENIYRHLAKGEEPVEAAINGRSEIGLAAITITLVDVVVFVPIAFMGGIVGQFFKSFGITVAIATLFSLFMSFTLTPMLASRWYKAGEAVEAHRGIFGAFNRFYSFLDRIYRRALEWALKYRGVVVYTGTGLLILVFLTIVISFAPMLGAMPFAMGNAVGMGVVFVAIAVFLAVRGKRPQGLGLGLLGLMLIAGKFGLPFFTVKLFLAGLFLAFALLMAGQYKTVSLITAAAGVAAVFLAFQIGASAGRPLLLFRFAPDLDQGQVAVRGELPAGTALSKTRAVAEQVEKVVAQNPDVESIFTTIGQSQTTNGAPLPGTQYFGMNLKLREKLSLGDSINPLVDKTHLRKNKDTSVADSLRKSIGEIPGVSIQVAAQTGFRGGGAPMQVDIQGSEIADLTKLGEKVLTVFKAEPGILNADISTRIGKPEQQIQIDRDKAASYGLSVAQISASLRTSLEGNNTDVKYRERGNEYPINVQFAESERENVNNVRDIVVGSVAGPGGVLQPVRLGDVAASQSATGPTKIDRMNRQKLVSVFANVAPGFAPGNLQLNIDKKLKEINFGVNTYSWGGENKTQAEEGQYMMAALGLAIILVYMLMAALFDNMLYPFIIMLSLPQAMIGALLALMISGQALTIVAMIGIIMLVGLVTKNAILLVDYSNTLRERGYSRTDAILEAGPTRLRPILMTTIAMVLGMLPTALALGRGGEFRAPVATAIIGGLLLSTMLTLLVIPCSYTYFDDFSRFLARRVFRRKIDEERPAPPKAEPAVVD